MALAPKANWINPHTPISATGIVCHGNRIDFAVTAHSAATMEILAIARLTRHERGVQATTTPAVNAMPNAIPNGDT